MLFLRPINNYFKTNKTFSQLFDNFVNDNEFSVFGSFKIDIKEENDSYILEAELPGLKKEEIKVEYRDEQLSIYVNREEKTDEQKENYIHRERKIASMKRSFYLKGINEDDITAKLENGILYVKAPKKEIETNKIIEVK